MKIRVFPSQLKGDITPPPSKSVTHRAYILAALVGDGKKVVNPLHSADTDATLDVLQGMGAEVEVRGDEVVFHQGVSHGVKLGDCKNSGTSLRLLSGVASLFPEKTVLTGDDSLLQRPIGQLTMALMKFGIDVSDRDGLPPIEITGPLPEGRLTTSILADASSQFVSSLLITGAARASPTEILLMGDVVSRPYIDLTIEMLREGGAEIAETESSYVITRGFQGCDFTVPADFSSIAFFAVAGALPGNHVGVKNVSLRYPQADSAIVDILKDAGAEMILEDGYLDVQHREINGLRLSLKASPDIFPILSVFFSHATSTSVLAGAHHLRLKETDRIRTVVSMLKSLGVNVTELTDGCMINGLGNIPGGDAVDSYGDHRLAMSAVIAASASDEPVVVNGVECISVSFPNFLDEFTKIGGQYEVIED